MCSYERAGQLGSQDLAWKNQDIGKRAGNFTIWTLQPSDRDECRMNSGSPDCIVLHCMLCFLCHKHPITICNCSDTALRVAEAIIGAKVKFLCFALFALFFEFSARTRPQHLWPFLISETGLKFPIWTQGEVRPSNRANPVNWVLVKRPSRREAKFCISKWPCNAPVFHFLYVNTNEIRSHFTFIVFCCERCKLLCNSHSNGDILCVKITCYCIYSIKHPCIY